MASSSLRNKYWLSSSAFTVLNVVAWLIICLEELRKIELWFKVQGTSINVPTLLCRCEKLILMKSKLGLSRVRKIKFIKENE